MELKFSIESRDGGEERVIAVNALIIAGWAARDKAAQEHHIRELEALGVAPPTTTPTYYRVAARRLSQDPVLEASGTASSGEVEPVLIATAEGLYVSVGSDHTDREVEAYGISVSKQMCDKPVASTAWPYAEVRDHWDSLELRSYATIDGERVLYQEGGVAALLAPPDLIGGYEGKDALAPGTAIFGGTLAAIGGVRPGTRFEGELTDPVLGRSIRFGYDIAPLPILG